MTMSTPLIDDFMPTYEVATQHGIEIDAPAESVYTTVRELDFSDSGLARAILWIRNSPARLRGEPGLGLTVDDLLDLGFILLADESPRELVVDSWASSGHRREISERWHPESSESSPCLGAPKPS